LFFYDKKVRYLQYYENEIRLQNAGYVRFDVRDTVCQMTICIKGSRLIGNAEARIWLFARNAYQEDAKKLLGLIIIRSGQGRQMMRLNTDDMGGTGMNYQQITGIRIELQRQQYLECRWEPEPTKEFAEEISIPPEDDGERQWEEWKQIFPIIHPLDDRDCLKLTPRNLEILPKEEHTLMHNSFLLHGFYNYRHLILWQEKTPASRCFCLGIPGMFHEREKILAGIFGFDYFCCRSNEPKTGSFGYYYRYVFTEHTSI